MNFVYGIYLNKLNNVCFRCSENPNWPKRPCSYFVNMPIKVSRIMFEEISKSLQDLRNDTVT